MFFIVRCIFWLSLVFAHLPDGPGAGKVDPNAIFDLARGQFASFTQRIGIPKANTVAGSDTLAAAALEGGAAWCKANGEACVDAILATMLAKSGTAADTLTPADRSLRRRI